MYIAAVMLITAVGLVACLTFVIGYWWVTRGRWATEEAGTFLMLFMMDLTALFAVVLFGQYIDAQVRQGIVLATYAGFVVMTWWPLRLLWIAQRERRNK